MYKLNMYFYFNLTLLLCIILKINIVSGCAARLNTTPPFTANKMMTLLEKCCSEVTPDNWRKVVEKTKKLCYDDWDRDVRYDTLEDQPLLINVGDSSCSSDSESETQTLMSLSDSE